MAAPPDAPRMGEAEGIDYGWVLQTTFVLTVVVGVPIVAVASLLVDLSDWSARAAFAGTLGGTIWLLTALATTVYARRRALTRRRSRDER